MTEQTVSCGYIRDEITRLRSDILKLRGAYQDYCAKWQHHIDAYTLLLTGRS